MNIMCLQHECNDSYAFVSKSENRVHLERIKTSLRTWFEHLKIIVAVGGKFVKVNSFCIF